MSEESILLNDIARKSRRYRSLSTGREPSKEALFYLNEALKDVAKFKKIQTVAAGVGDPPLNGKTTIACAAGSGGQIAMVEEVNLPKRKKNKQAKFVGLFGEDISPAKLSFLNKNNSAAGGMKDLPSMRPPPLCKLKVTMVRGLIRPLSIPHPLLAWQTRLSREMPPRKAIIRAAGTQPRKMLRGGPIAGLTAKTPRFDASRDANQGSIILAKNNPSPRDSVRNVKGSGVDLSSQNVQGKSNGSNMEWTSVQAKRGRRGAGVSTSPKIPANPKNNVETRNRFVSIATDEAGDVFSPVDTREGIRKNPNKIPNIHLDNVKNWALLYKNMKTSCAFPPVARLAGRRTVKVRKRLFVIRDLPINLGVEEIKDSLEEQGVQSKCTPSIDFLAIRYVCGLKIRIEKHRPPKGPPQCHRCQLFGHTDKACHMPPRCVKCGGNHLTADCKKEAGGAAVCANCKGDHPASYRGCTVYSKLKQRLNDLKNKAHNKIKKTENPQAPMTNGEKDIEPNREATRSYAEAARGEGVRSERPVPVPKKKLRYLGLQI
ncbi:hypothetical protein J437_LFUL004737 [Ladona fulva]|uniref:Gag-like protein n=1 Tax=Ladona fulva TaxID=123851 RepID=A0A8K0NVZ5_LADFU|nr:hypothetical protein J437_LFUL004737 [Ladona fulva]